MVYDIISWQLKRCINKTDTYYTVIIDKSLELQKKATVKI